MMTKTRPKYRAARHLQYMDIMRAHVEGELVKQQVKQKREEIDSFH